LHLACEKITKFLSSFGWRNDLKTECSFQFQKTQAVSVSEFRECERLPSGLLPHGHRAAQQGGACRLALSLFEA
jgi:hypothetical protein